MSTTLALVISALLLILNGFFVAAEFALVASKRHRLEEAAASGSRSARAAIAGVSELSLMLAGAQLGITLCTLGLGSLAEPAVAHLLHPLFELIGLPEGVGHVIALIIAVAGIALLHVLLGEMAPKSWAISNPERSAQLLALPFRGFTFVFRPLLLVLNWLANLCVRALKVTPQNELASAHGPDELRLLIESSRRARHPRSGRTRSAHRDARPAEHHGRPGDDADLATQHGPGRRLGPRGRAHQPPRRPLPPGSRQHRYDDLRHRARP